MKGKGMWVDAWKDGMGTSLLLSCTRCGAAGLGSSEDGNHSRQRPSSESRSSVDNREDNAIVTELAGTRDLAFFCWQAAAGVTKFTSGRQWGVTRLTALNAISVIERHSFGKVVAKYQQGTVEKK